jgi:arylsulfatase A-like enzyme
MLFRLLGIMALVAIGFCEAAGPATARPHIIVVLADDLGYGDLSSYGGATPTPHLDRMARDGTRFTQFYVASPICSPSRAGLLTGQFPGRWKVTSYLQSRRGNRGCEQDDFLDPKAPSLPRILKSAGYATAHVGKWHLGGGRDVTNAPPFSAYGFDAGFGTYESPEPHRDITSTNWIWSTNDPIKRHERTEWMVNRTLEFIGSRQGQPCFVNLWLDDTHTPYVPSREQLAAIGVTSQRPTDYDNYRAVLAEMDRQIGRLVGGLRSLSADTNTLILFLGDNGALPVFAAKRNGNLRASKLSLYEGGIRVPFIAWLPGRVPHERVNESSVLAAVDLLPTICAIAKAPLPEGYKSDGEDVSGALFGRPFTRSQPLFFEYGRNTNWFAFPKPPRDRSPNVAMRQGNWKLLVNGDGTQAELYDVVADPGETKNVAEKQAPVVQRMREAAVSWRKSLP